MAFSATMLAPRPNATVTVNGHSYTSDASGRFILTVQADQSALHALGCMTLTDAPSLVTDPVPQSVVAAGQTLPLTRAKHQGTTVILGGTGATISLDAAAEGDGFCVRIVNDTGADWTVPAVAGATLRFDTAGNTAIAAGGSASLETYTRDGTRYVAISGATA